MSNLRSAIQKLETNHQAFTDLVDRIGTGNTIFTGWSNQPKIVVDAWVEFMVKEAMPRNREIQAHLERVYPEHECDPPPIVVEFYQYVADYNMLIEWWANGRTTPYQRPTTGTNFPVGLETFLKQDL